MNKEYMDIAIEEAKQAYIEDEVPIGCVIVRNGEIIARAHNQKVHSNKATHHAEVLAINAASEALDSWYLDECDLYVTLEPCLMCTGAIINARIKKVYFATPDPKGGALVSNIKIYNIKNLNHYPEIEQGLDQEEASLLLKNFFKEKRLKGKEKK